MANTAKTIGTATVASGQTLSNAVDLISAQGPLVGLECPALGTDTSIKLQLSTTIAGTYRTLLLSDLSGDWEIISGTENLFVFVPELAVIRFAKILLGASQGSGYSVNFVGRG